MIVWQGMKDKVIFPANDYYDSQNNMKGQIYANALTNYRYVEDAEAEHSVNDQGWNLMKSFLTYPSQLQTLSATNDETPIGAMSLGAALATASLAATVNLL